MSTPARKAELINDLREQRDALYRALERLSDAELSTPQFDRDRERTSVYEELIRLADAEAVYRSWVEHARSVAGADVRGEPQPVSDLDADAYSIGEIVDALAFERRQTLATIRDLEPREFLRLVHVPGATLNLDELVSALVRHDREIANAITRRDGSLLPRFFSRARSLGLEHV